MQFDTVYPLLVLWPLLMGLFLWRRWPQVRATLGSGRLRPDETLRASTRDTAGLPLDADVCLEGVVRANEFGPLSSPQGGRPCVWWRNDVTTTQLVGPDQQQTFTSPQLFYLEDAHGRIAVLPAGLNFMLPVDNRRGGLREQTREWVLAPDTAVRIIAQVGQNADGLRFLHRANPESEAALGLQQDAGWMARLSQQRRVLIAGALVGLLLYLQQFLPLGR